MLNSIDEELRAGVIRRIPRELIKWEHPSHLIPKKNGKLRKIMNVSAFNKHMLKAKFKLEGQRLLMQLLQTKYVRHEHRYHVGIPPRTGGWLGAALPMFQLRQQDL
jgi:hypothetical protein